MDVGFAPGFKNSMDKCFGKGWWAVRRFFVNAYWEIVNFPHKFARAFGWFCFMYSNNSYDYSQLYKVIVRKLLEMKTAFKENNRVEKMPKICTQIDDVINNIKLCQVDFTDSYEYREFTRKYGELSMESAPANEQGLSCVSFSFTKIKKVDYKKVDKIYHKLSDAHTRQCEIYRTLAFKTIAKYIEYWWD